MTKQMKDILLYSFGGIIVLLCAISLLWIFQYEIPEENQKTAYFILGVLWSGGFTTIVNFFFGSSQGSKDKTEVISKTNSSG